MAMAYVRCAAFQDSTWVAVANHENLRKEKIFKF